MNPVVHWSFHDYVEGGKNRVEDWYMNTLSDEGRFMFNSVLKNASTTKNHREWGGFKPLKGDPKKHAIWEIKFTADRRAYRIMGVFDGQKKAVLLLGCFHKQRVYTPTGAIEIVCERARQLQKREAQTSERKIKSDL